jgi:DNA polymerase III subunit alpha
MRKEFSHLHLHTVHSLLDGFTKMPDLVKAVTDHKMDAVAVTDHGNMSGIPYLFQEAHAHGIKPVAGIEAYICEDVNVRGGGRNAKSPYYHITLLARSERGYRNLCKLSSMSYEMGFYVKPRIDPSMLALYGEDIICLSGCVGGWPSVRILEGELDVAREAIGTLRSIFEEFYLELTWTGEPDQKIVNKQLIEWGKKDGIPCVVTGDSHYTWKAQADDHDTLFAMGLHKKKNDLERLRFKPGQYFVKSADEMYALGFPEDACKNSFKITRLCDRYELPKAAGVPVEKNAYDNLCKLAWDGLEERVPDFFQDPEDTYVNRLLMELETVKELKYEGYFAIAHDVCRFAREACLTTGWGRGSSAGSLLSYVLRITHIDPIQYGLYFERFLSKARKEPPDIDLDFSDDERSLVIGHLREKHGEESIAHIATYGTLGPRQVIIDSSKVLDKPDQAVQMALESLPHDPTIKMQDILANEGLIGHIKTILGNDTVHAMEVFQGIPRSASVHAAGVLIDKSDLRESLPFMVAKNGGLTVQYDYDALKSLGYEKFDILGVRTLRVIRDCARIVNCDVYRLPTNDMATYDLLCRGDTVGVFQLEGWGYQTFLKKFRPRNFIDVMMTNALYRPGPMQGGKGLDEIIARRFGRTEVRYLHHTLEPILKDTYGVMVFQEQVMAVVRELAGWDLATANELRYAIGKKKIDQIKAFRSRYIEDCMRFGHKQTFAEESFTQIEFFSRYGWNKAHAAAYGMVTYVTAYLKAHHRKEFMTAILNSELGNHDKLGKLYRDITKSGIKILSPDINISTLEYQAHNGGILLGIPSVKGVGPKAAVAILEERDKSGNFSSIRDFEVRIPRKSVNSLMRKLLTNAGAFRDLKEESDEDHMF